MDATSLVGVLLACGVLYTLYKRHLGPSLRDVPGPEPESFWLGEYLA